MSDVPEPHHPSWVWRNELWIMVLLTGGGAVVAWLRELPAAATVLTTAGVVQAALLLTTYWREALRLQRVEDRERQRAERDVS